MRFGIEEKREYTSRSSVRSLGVTRERIRQIEQRSFQILRKPSQRKPAVPTATGTESSALAPDNDAQDRRAAQT